MNSNGDHENMQDWIQRILNESSRKLSSTKISNEDVPPESGSEKSCMDAHRDILHMEADFQVP